MARFLDRLATPGRAWTRSALQAACGVNYDIFRRYLAFLEGRGFVASGTDGSEALALTPAGRGAHDRVLAIVREFLADPPAVAGALPTTQRAAGGPRASPTAADRGVADR